MPFLCSLSASPCWLSLVVVSVTLAVRLIVVSVTVRLIVVVPVTVRLIVIVPVTVRLIVVVPVTVDDGSVSQPVDHREDSGKVQDISQR